MGTVKTNTKPLVPAGGDLLLRFLKALHRGEARPLASLLLAHRHELANLADRLVKERLAVQAYAALGELKLQPLFPRASWSLLEDQWRQQRRRNAELLQALARIDWTLREAGIEYRLLKGLYLGERFYGGPDQRFTWDLDLLVRPADIWKTLDLLDELGFAKPSFSLGLERLAPQVAHALECRRADGLSVDLHWAFRRLPGLRVDEAALWRQGGCHRLGGLDCPVPPDEYTLLQLLLGIAADLDRGLCRLRAVWDIYMALKGMADPDWPGFLARREAEGSARLAVNALALVLFRLDCRDEFPALAAALDGRRDGSSIHSAEQARTILARAPHGLENHLLYARWQPLPQWRYWAWWAATLPLRFFFARRI